MKVLCLGTNDRSTDDHVDKLSAIYQSTNHGLIEDPTFVPVEDGYYHTTVADMGKGEIDVLAEQFDKVVLLPQPREQWSHWKLFLTTYKLVKDLENRMPVEYDASLYTGIKTFENLLDTNKSFCIYPFVLLTEDQGHVTTCARSATKIADSIQDVGDYYTSDKFIPIREAMLKGEKLPHCETCYYYEDRGIDSSRKFETMEWVNKLDLKELDDLLELRHPHYYEIRLSNKCNLMCRSCRPEHSHLIEKEYETHKIQHPNPLPFKFSNFSHVHIPSLNDKTRIYLTGGEPTVMQEFYDFCDECIKLGHTDFDFTIGTNAQTFTPKFWSVIKHFTNMNFSVSVDGFGKYNDYQRWKSDFDTVMANSKKLAEAGHNVTFLVVPGIFNVTNLHLLFEYFDENFPKAALYVQINHNPLQDPYNHPFPELVVESMRKCQKTKIYHSDGRSCTSTIDSLLDYYSNDPVLDREKLAKFFDYNDQIDRARDVSLVDYIPELDAGRKFLLDK